MSRLLQTTGSQRSQIAEVIMTVSRAGGLEYARERALRLARSPRRARLVPPSAAREALRASITYVIDRRR